LTAQNDLPLLFGNVTDIGLGRNENEDFLGYFRVGDRHLFVVADGMGGVEGGRRASHCAVERTRAVFEEEPQANPEQVIRRAFEAAHQGCLEIQRAQPELAGMGTTLEILIVKGGQAWLGHIGDSRIYRVRDGVAELLTVDHTRVRQMVDAGMISEEQAREHPQRHVLARAVGGGASIEPDVSRVPVEIKESDAFVLCTDGLTDLVANEEIGRIVVENGPQDACRKLVQLALDRGGHDNVTLQVVYRGHPVSSWMKAGPETSLPTAPPRSSRRWPQAALVAIAAAAFAMAAVAAAGWWLSLIEPPALPEPGPVFILSGDVLDNAAIDDSDDRLVVLPVVAAMVGVLRPTSVIDERELGCWLTYSHHDLGVGESTTTVPPLHVRMLGKPRYRASVTFSIPFVIPESTGSSGSLALVSVDIESIALNGESDSSVSGWQVRVEDDAVKMCRRRPEMACPAVVGHLGPGACLHVLFVSLGSSGAWLSLDGLAGGVVIPGDLLSETDGESVGWSFPSGSDGRPSDALRNGGAAVSIGGFAVFTSDNPPPYRLAPDVLRWYRRAFEYGKVRQELTTTWANLAGAIPTTVPKTGHLLQQAGHASSVEPSGGSPEDDKEE
jgi:serine/threonine protein phosphatase PrpC